MFKARPRQIMASKICFFGTCINKLKNNAVMLNIKINKVNLGHEYEVYNIKWPLLALL